MKVLGTLRQALKGIGGEYEINRVLSFFGTVTYIVGFIGFTFHDVVIKGKPFDMSTFALQFPSGLAILLGGTAGAVALKDKFVSQAKVVTETNAFPANPPAPPPLTTEAGASAT